MQVRAQRVGIAAIGKREVEIMDLRKPLGTLVFKA